MEEWPTAGCFLSESLTPVTPPVIESWSSSSSNDDNSQIANASASTSNKKPKKRKILSRLKTKLNFDECVLTQRKNQQWVTPKVTKILRQCLDEDEVPNVKEQTENMLHLKESVVGRSNVTEKPFTESSSSSVGFVDISPGQCSVQDLLKRKLSHTSSKSSSFGISTEPSGSLHKKLDTPEKISLDRAHFVMSSSQETDFEDAQDLAKSFENLETEIDSVNASESCTTSSSPIIKQTKISCFKKKRKRISLSPVIDLKMKSLQKSVKVQRDVENLGEATMLSNSDKDIQESPMNFESTLSSGQEENIQLSPVITSFGIRRIRKRDEANGEVNLAAASTEKSPGTQSNETSKPIGTRVNDSHTSESDFDSIIEATQLSPIIKLMGRRSSKRRNSKEKVSSFIADCVASTMIGQNYQGAKSAEITPLINRQNLQLNQSASNHSSPSAPINRTNSPAFNTDESLCEPPKSPIIKLSSCKKTRKNSLKNVQKNLVDSFRVSETSSESEALSSRVEKKSEEKVVQGSLCEPPKSPVIKLLSCKKTRKNNLKKVQKNLVDSFRVSETSSESEALSSTIVKTSVEQVVQGSTGSDSQSDYVESSQRCPAVFMKRKSSGKSIESSSNTSNTSSTERLECELSGEKEMTIVPPFKDFLMPLPLSSLDTQNPSDYNISVDLDTQNLTQPLKQSPYCHLVKNSSNIFSSDSSPMNISFSTQDSMDLIVNSLLGKKRTLPDRHEAEAITIDSFSSQDTSLEARVPLPGKITTVSDLPSPKSSGYQIATCSSQSADHTSPVRDEEPCVNMDSAKKKKRLQKGGYAIRLQTLLNRQKSASRIFQHEMLNNAEKLINKGTRLHVDLMWHEFDKVLLQCTFSAEENKEETALLLMDPNQCKKIATNCVITIYPPWRVLTIPKNSAKVITDVFNFQVISAGDELQTSQRSLIAVVEEFKCKCLELPSRSAKCAFKLPRNGLEIFEVLFPNILSFNAPSRQTMQTTACDGTVSELLALPSGVSDKYIDICIQRVFHFNDIDKQEICWSLLGQDSRGELSEVILPSRHAETTAYDSIVAGDVYRVSVVNVMKRIHRNKSPGLWAVIDCKNKSVELPSTSNFVALTDNECNLKHLYIYLITATSDQDNVKKLDSVFNWARHSWMKPKISNLFSVLNMQSSDSYSMFSFRVKVLFVTENILYITDLSLSHIDQSYCTVGLRPSFYLPADVASKKCGVAFLQDVQLLKGQLFMDRYSRMETLTDQWPVVVLRTLQAEKIIFGGVVATSSAKDLVSVSGEIIGVDEETAFEWLACVECSGNVLTVKPDGNNLCHKCNKTVLGRPMMSLEILVMAGDIVVKIKLQQSTIKLLLPPSQNDGEGFEIARVLGKQIGPVDCLVLQSVTNEEFSFVLEELPRI